MAFPHHSQVDSTDYLLKHIPYLVKVRKGRINMTDSAPQFRTIILLILASVAFCAPLAHAQAPGKKPAAKPPAKSSSKPPVGVKPSGPIVLGTNQMPGDFGKLNTTYTIGKSSPINFTLKSVEYSLIPLSIGNSTWVPKADEKLLVLRYTVQNPTPQPQRYYWADILFTAVDNKDVNHEFINAISRDGLQEPLDISLKPAQKLEIITAIVVPAEGVVPKLIVQRERDAPVIRYDLRGKAKPLPATVADTADASGTTPMKVIPAQPSTFYSIGVFDARLDEVAYVTVPLSGREPGEGKQWLTATFTIKNRSSHSNSYVWSDFLPELRDADGEKVDYNQSILKASRDESASGELAPGEEARIRFYFELPKDVTGKTLRLREGKRVDAREAHVFAYDLTSAPTKKP
jgi:hypothetical protein